MSQAGRLAGTRVLVTRPKERSQELCFLLEDEGAEVIALPLLELLPPTHEQGLRAAAEQLQRYAWVAFASPSAVQALLEAARNAGTSSHLSRLKLAAVGPRTAQALREHGLKVELEAEQASGAGLAAALAPKLDPGTEVLLPAAEDGRRELEQDLREAGLAVTRVAAYRSAEAATDDAAWRELAARPPAVALFASPRTAESFLGAGGEQARTLAAAARLVAIGPTTARAMEGLGLPVAAVAEQPTAAGLVEAAVRALGRE